MASTAAITLSSSTCKAEQKVTATCTITNGGASTLYVTSVTPVVVPSGLTAQTVSAGIGQVPLGGAFNSTLLGSGTLAVSFDMVPHTPTSGYGLSEPASQVYTVGANVSLSDGSVFAATTANLTVSNPSLL